MHKLTKKAIRSRQTDPNYRKASLLKYCSILHNQANNKANKQAWIIYTKFSDAYIFYGKKTK